MQNSCKKSEKKNVKTGIPKPRIKVMGPKPV